MIKRKLSLPALLLVCLLTACSLFASNQGTPGPGDEPVAAATDTLAVSLTPSETPQPTFTYTPENVTISVSMDTNCRLGPGEVYDWVGGLMVGETAQVLAIDPTGKYFYIANPTGPGYCWVWGYYATVVGDTSPLPVYTPMPTPTPIIDFGLDYVGIDRCSAMRYTRLKVTNIGVLTWESVKATITDLNTAEVSYPKISDLFIDAYTCQEIANVPNVPAGASAIFHTNGFDYDMPGHSYRADVTLCSQDGLMGTCVTHTINFTP